MSASSGNVADPPILPSPEASRKLDVYLEMLDAWNRRFNLTSGSEAGGIRQDLVQDSFYLASFLEKFSWPEDALIFDLGAGQGLPGIPLRLVWTRGKYVMVEAREKRALFLANVLARLRLENTAVSRSRAEEFLRKQPPARCLLGRAFMPWQKLLPFCRPHLAEDGIIVIMANAAPPQAPSGWMLADKARYRIQAAGGREREGWFWAFGKAGN